MIWTPKKDTRVAVEFWFAVFRSLAVGYILWKTL